MYWLMEAGKSWKRYGMSDGKVKPLVFSTRILDKSQMQKLKGHGISVEQYDFIKIKHIFDESSLLKRLNNPITQARVFTSKNSLHKMRKLIGNSSLKLNPKKNFVVGISAAKMLRDFGIKVNASADNAISLAHIMARNHDIKAVDYFCGDKALNDLPEYLESKSITTNKEIVYQTEVKHKKVFTSNLNGVIFLSPTAVSGFFKKNSLPPDIPIFVIGTTTQKTVHFHCTNKCILADKTSLTSVTDKVIQYFNRSSKLFP